MKRRPADEVDIGAARCSDCRFGVQEAYAVMCRRFPARTPQRPDDWCGEFKPNVRKPR